MSEQIIQEPETLEEIIRAALRHEAKNRTAAAEILSGARPNPEPFKVAAANLHLLAATHFSETAKAARALLDRVPRLPTRWRAANS